MPIDYQRYADKVKRKVGASPTPEFVESVVGRENVYNAPLTTRSQGAGSKTPVRRSPFDRAAEQSQVRQPRQNILGQATSRVSPIKKHSLEQMQKQNEKIDPFVLEKGAEVYNRAVTDPGVYSGHLESPDVDTLRKLGEHDIEQNEPGLFKHMAASAARGTEQFIGGIGGAGSRWAGDILNIEPLSEFGEQFQDRMETAAMTGWEAPSGYMEEQEFTSAPIKKSVGWVAGAVPSLVAGLATGAGLAALGAPTAVASGVGALFLSLAETAPEYVEMRESGMSEAEATKWAAPLTAGVAALEYTPFKFFLKPFKKAGSKAASKGALESLSKKIGEHLGGASRVSSALTGTAAEGVQESLQTVLQNITAKATYDDARKWHDQLLESFIGGAGAGGIAGAVLRPGSTYGADGTDTGVDAEATAEQAEGVAQREQAVEQYAQQLNETKDSIAEEMEAQGLDPKMADDLLDLVEKEVRFIGEDVMAHKGEPEELINIMEAAVTEGEAVEGGGRQPLSKDLKETATLAVNALKDRNADLRKERSPQDISEAKKAIESGPLEQVSSWALMNHAERVVKTGKTTAKTPAVLEELRRRYQDGEIKDASELATRKQNLEELAEVTQEKSEKDRIQKQIQEIESDPTYAQWARQERAGDPGVQEGNLRQLRSRREKIEGQIAATKSPQTKKKLRSDLEKIKRKEARIEREAEPEGTQVDMVPEPAIEPDTATVSETEILEAEAAAQYPVEEPVAEAAPEMKVSEVQESDVMASTNAPFKTESGAANAIERQQLENYRVAKLGPNKYVARSNEVPAPGDVTEGQDIAFQRKTSETQPNRTRIIANRQGQPVGEAVVGTDGNFQRASRRMHEPVGEDEQVLRLYEIGLEDQYQGRGYGKQLFERVFKEHPNTWIGSSQLGLGETKDAAWGALRSVPGIEVDVDNTGHWVARVQEEVQEGVAEPARGMDKQAVRDFLTERIAGFKKVPTMTVVQSVSDINSQVVQDEIAKRGVDTGSITAVWNGNKITFVGDNLTSEAEIESAMNHDLFGHYGVEAVLTRSQADKFYRDVYNQRKDTAEFRDVIRDYGLDIANEADQTKAAKEYTARMAEAGVDDSLITRLIGLVRSGLRKVGVKLELSDTDIRRLIAIGARQVKKGGGIRLWAKDTTAEGDGMPVFQRIDIAAADIDVSESAQATAESEEIVFQRKPVTTSDQTLKFIRRNNDGTVDEQILRKPTHGQVNKLQQKGYQAEELTELDDAEATRRMIDDVKNQVDNTKKHVYQRLNDQLEAAYHGALNSNDIPPSTVAPTDMPRGIVGALNTLWPTYAHTRKYEPLHRMFEAADRAKSFVHKRMVEARDDVARFTRMSKEEAAPVEAALLIEDQNKKNYTQNDYKNGRYGLPTLTEDQYVALEGVRKALHNALLQSVKDSLPETLARQLEHRTELANIIDRAQNKEQLKKDVTKYIENLQDDSIEVTKQDLNHVSFMFDWINEHRGFFPHKWKHSWRVRVSVPTKEGEPRQQWIRDFGTGVARVLPTGDMRRSAAVKRAEQVITEEFQWGPEAIAEGKKNSDQVANLIKRKEQVLRGKAQNRKQQAEEIQEKIDDIINNKPIFQVIHSTELPNDMFSGARPEDISSILSTSVNNTMKKLSADNNIQDIAPEVFSTLDNELRRTMELLYIRKGGHKHLAPRKNIKGYRTDVRAVVQEYLAEQNNLRGNRDLSREMAAVMEDIDPQRQPKLWQEAKEYMQDLVAPSPEATAFKRVVGTMALGFDISAATLNATQNFTHGVSVLRAMPKVTEDTVKKAVVKLHPGKQDVTADVEAMRAMKHVTEGWIQATVTQRAFKKSGGLEGDEFAQTIPEGGLKDKNGNWVLTPTETKILRGMTDSGQLDPQLLGEQTGFYSNQIGGGRSVSDLMFKMFSGTEALNRLSLSLAAVRRSLAAGQSVEEAQAAATNAVREAHFPYGRSNRPMIVRRLDRATGKLALGSSGFTFMTYPMMNLVFIRNYVWNVLDAKLAGDKDAVRTEMKKIGTHLGYTTMFGGITAAPFYGVWQAIAHLFGDDDDEDWETTIRRHTDEVLGRGITRGVPALFNFDLSQRVEGTDVWGTPIGFQVLLSYKDRFGDFWEMAGRDEYSTALFHLMPDFLRNPYLAGKGYVEGGESMYGPPIKYSMPEAIVKAVGYPPTRESEVYSATMQTLRLQQGRSGLISSLAKRYVNDPGDIKKIRKDLLEYNNSVKKKGRGAPPPIRWSEVQSAIRREQKTRTTTFQDRPAKYMEQTHRSLMESFTGEER